MVKALEKNSINDHMISVPMWHLSPDHLVIVRNLKFKNFKDAFAFMNKVAIVAEDMNHHPNWMNVYNEVNIALTTHDCQGLSSKDFELARTIDGILESISHENITPPHHA